MREMLMKPPKLSVVVGSQNAKQTIVECLTSIAHCIPDKDWLLEILNAHESSYVAVGGAIECANGASLVDWAIYFCRYTPFMKPFSEGIVQEVPGDNASYKRKALEGCKDLWEDGYFVRTVGDKVTAEVIKKYIEYHWKEEKHPNQLELF